VPHQQNNKALNVFSDSKTKTSKHNVVHKTPWHQAVKVKNILTVHDNTKGHSTRTHLMALSTG